MAKQTILFGTVALVALNLVLGVFFIFRSAPPSYSPDLTNAKMAVAELKGQRIYYTPSAQAELQKQKPELRRATEEVAFARATQDPAFWRQLDHRLHFDALLLSGDPGEYRPLLRHLLETRDWVLTYLDHTSMIFKRPPVAEWNPDALTKLEERFTGADRAVFLVGAANKLLALGLVSKAKALLDESLSLDGKSADGWTQMALYHAQIGQWPEALQNCDRALAIAADFAPALAAKAQILFGARRFDEAMAISERAVAANPQNPSVLFLDAKIAHEAHAFQREIETMGALVKLAEQKGAPVAGYRIYLGQAYAADSQGQSALEQFEKAQTEDLSPAQRKFVEEAITRLKSRIGS